MDGPAPPSPERHPVGHDSDGVTNARCDGPGGQVHPVVEVKRDVGQPGLSAEQGVDPGTWGIGLQQSADFMEEILLDRLSQFRMILDLADGAHSQIGRHDGLLEACRK